MLFSKDKTDPGLPKLILLLFNFPAVHLDQVQ